MIEAAHNKPSNEEVPISVETEENVGSLLDYFEAFNGTEQYAAIDQALHQVGIMPDDMENISEDLIEEAKELIDRIATADDEQGALEAAQKLDGLLWPDPQAE